MPGIILENDNIAHIGQESCGFGNGKQKSAAYLPSRQNPDPQPLTKIQKKMERIKKKKEARRHTNFTTSANYKTRVETGDLNDSNELRPPPPFSPSICDGDGQYFGRVRRVERKFTSLLRLILQPHFQFKLWIPADTPLAEILIFGGNISLLLYKSIPIMNMLSAHRPPITFRLHSSGVAMIFFQWGHWGHCFIWGGGGYEAV